MTFDYFLIQIYLKYEKGKDDTFWSTYSNDCDAEFEGWYDGNERWLKKWRSYENDKKECLVHEVT